MKSRRLARALAEYERRNPESASLVRGVRRWVESAGDDLLWRVNVYRLADELGLKRKALLELFITLTFEDIFELNWDFHCTECNAVAGTHHHLRDATAVSHCPLCDVDFRNDLIHNVEVTFSPASGYYSVSKRFLDRELARTVELHRAKKIRLPLSYVRGIDCLHVRLFREVFDAETLALRENLRIGRVCIMFTDIKGSTELYDRLGDTAAYGLVRNHFEILFDQIERHNGVVVKTIGDAVMASFTRSADGVAAAVAIQEAFRSLNSRKALRDEVLVKVGIHTGGTIMVNLNNRLDYFGQTVNLAARIQGSADGGEVIVSETVRRDPAAVLVLKGHVSGVTKRLAELKGIRGAKAIFRLNFTAPAERVVPAGEARRPVAAVYP